MALLLGIGVAILGGVSFHRKLDTFQPLGFAAALHQGAWQVSAAAPETSLSAGDEILLVQGDVVNDRAALEESLRSRALSELMVRRKGVPEQLTYVRPPLVVDYAYLILVGIGVAYLLIGLYTFVKDRQLHALLFCLWCLASAALFLLSPEAVPPDALGMAIFLIDQLARVFLPALTLHLFLIFPTPLLRRRRLAAVLPFVYLPAAVQMTFHVDQVFLGGKLFGPPDPGVLARVDELELYLLIFFAFLSGLALVVRLSRTTSWEHRRQLQWIGLGLAGGYLPFLLLYVLPHSFGFEGPAWLSALAVLPLWVMPLAFAYAILKYKLWDIGLILRDSVAYSLTVLVGLLGFSLINLVIQRGLASDLTLVRNLLTFVAGVGIAGVLVPTRNAISAGLEHLQYRGVLGQRRALHEFSQELLYERDLDQLCTSLLDHLTEGLSIERSNLYLAQGSAMVPVLPSEGVPRQLPFDTFGDAFWQRTVESISAVALPAEELAPEQRLFIRGYRYAFPLTVRGHRVGVVLLSYKYDAKPLSSEDVDLARGLLNQAALAIENAQLLEEVHRKLEEVMRLKEHNRGILESSPAGIAVLDEAGMVVSANHAFAAIAEIRRPDLTGLAVEGLLPVRPLPAPGDGLVEVSFCELSGRERYLQLSLARYDEGGESSLRVLVVQDVSERVGIELALKEKERLAALGMLAAGVAHEVNTPITGLSSYTQMLLAETDTSDPHYELLRKMERQTFRAAQIVNNLLEFARNRRDELHPLALEAVVTEALTLLAERASEAGVEVVWQPPAERLAVLGNEGELHQVFTNLIVNAIDAMGATGGRLTVEVEALEHRVITRLSDTGTGIPPERLEKIFQPFFSSKLGKGGTGLGLAITYNIVRRHAGEIRAHNHDTGPGCTFVVELPRHLPH